MLMMLVAAEHGYPLHDKENMYKNSLNYNVNSIRIILNQNLQF